MVMQLYFTMQDLTQTVKGRSWEVAILLRKSKYFAQNLELFGLYWRFLTKISGNSGLIIKCKQKEKKLILWRIHLKIFLNFSQIEDFDFWVDHLGKSKQIWTQKVKIRFFISIRFFCEDLQWNYRSSESNPRCFFSAFYVKCKYKFQQKIVRNLPIIIRILTYLVKWQLLTISILSSA